MKYALISQVLETLDNIYSGYAAKHAEAVQALRLIPEQEKAARTDRRFSTEGRKYRLAELKQKADELRATLANIETESKAEFRKVWADAENSFPQFKARPEDIDRDMLSLFDSGVLRPEEMLELSARYEGRNVTMSRLLGARMLEYAEQHADIMNEWEQHGEVKQETPRAQVMKDVYAAGNRLKDAESPLETVLGKYQVAFDAALRAAEDGEAGAGIQGAAYDEMYAETEALAKRADSAGNLLNIYASSPD